MVHKYRVSFFKRLADSTGHAVDACQATLEVSATTKRRAIEQARRRFAEHGRIAAWSLRADYATAELVQTHVPDLAPHALLHRLAVAAAVPTAMPGWRHNRVMVREGGPSTSFPRPRKPLVDGPPSRTMTGEDPYTPSPTRLSPAGPKRP